MSLGIEAGLMARLFCIDMSLLASWAIVADSLLRLVRFDQDMG